MRFTRKRRRRQKEKTARQRAILPVLRVTACWVLPATIAATGLPYTLAGGTYALLSARSQPGQQAAAQFSTLSTQQAFAATANSVDLGQITAGQHVERKTDAFQLQNISKRALDITVRVEGVKGLTAVITPSHLVPGQTAHVRITGSVAAVGNVRARLYVEAFGGFLSLELPLHATVVAPPPPPPTECAGGEKSGDTPGPNKAPLPPSDSGAAPCGPPEPGAGPVDTPPQQTPPPGVIPGVKLPPPEHSPGLPVPKLPSPAPGKLPPPQQPPEPPSPVDQVTPGTRPPTLAGSESR
ncbi:MAG: hypothetical protein JWN15_1317 [Firmicutes bacterium]|nr:hypothetical protein [Bacillota bacterium]